MTDRLKNALIKGTTSTLEADLKEALEEYGTALAVIEGPLMAGMEAVGKLFGEGKMFLPQVVKSAKVMRDAVDILEPFMDNTSRDTGRPKVVIATVKGDVHDIGKNITGIVLTCNGFDVHDLGVMVDKETILDAAAEINADIIAVSGLITPSLYQMEEICREMSERGMDTPLFVGGATTSAVHTAVKLAPLYAHVFHGADASAAAVMAKKSMMDRDAFEEEQHAQQKKLRLMYERPEPVTSRPSETVKIKRNSYATTALPEDMAAVEIPHEEVLPYFDWKMFYAIWGVKYGSVSPEAMELMQLRRDAEDELALGNFKVSMSARYFHAYSDGKDLIMVQPEQRRIPMLRQEDRDGMSLCDFVMPESLGMASSCGVFTICIRGKDVHEEGCCCPACSSKYEDLVGKAVRMTLAEAASKWLDKKLQDFLQDDLIRVIKPAAGYASCPDHTLKKDIMELLSGKFDLGIKLTESYAMTPEASICGFIFMHPQAKYHEIRRISRGQYEDYAARRGMSEETARRFLGHLLK